MAREATQPGHRNASIWLPPTLIQYSLQKASAPEVCKGRAYAPALPPSMEDLTPGELGWGGSGGSRNPASPQATLGSVERKQRGTSLVAQWLRLCTSSAGGRGSILGQGTKIPHASHAPPPKKRKKAERRDGLDKGDAASCQEGNPMFSCLSLSSRPHARRT